MYPADAVIGWALPNGTAAVGAYRILDKDPTAIVPITNGTLSPVLS
jgi:hypothetical protein